LPLPPQKSTEAQGHGEQWTDELRRVDHGSKQAVATRFEDYPGDEQDVEQQDHGSGTPQGVCPSAILW